MPKPKTFEFLTNSSLWMSVVRVFRHLRGQFLRFLKVLTLVVYPLFCVFWTAFIIPAWYINKFTIIDFTIYTQLFLVKLKSIVDGPILHSKSVVDGPILHSKSVVDGSILHSKAKVCVFSVFMMVKLLIYHTGMCIKGPESWWIAKSITPQLVVNQSKINPQLPSVVVD